jgi:hypothetical protein
VRAVRFPLPASNFQLPIIIQFTPHSASCA